MNTNPIEEYFCVVSLKESGKTRYFYKIRNPSDLATSLQNNGEEWVWIKGYENNQDYINNQNSYLFIFDEKNPPNNFENIQFSKN